MTGPMTQRQRQKMPSVADIKKELKRLYVSEPRSRYGLKQLAQRLIGNQSPEAWTRIYTAIRQLRREARILTDTPLIFYDFKSEGYFLVGEHNRSASSRKHGEMLNRAIAMQFQAEKIDRQIDRG